ncbi:rhomboid family intramembrane serine protease [Halapricum salinum]|uniref:Rhomboid family intramembrane serine protease n=1 Tax=Halapricum salinum TaxID=1457250 RepID=A0A4D6HE85_9EURY|nr:rhomboid family intramembrane serine protease [Halapricum salinum]QCC51352.1 rhomboid family intramembrane serine protease [Halapricum salinum]
MVALTAVVLAALLAGVGWLVWTNGGSERWRALTDDRFVYGVPWGTLVAVALVTAFYLLAQHGLTSWNEPLTLPFVSWSWFYPVGVLTSGFAHGSPAHLLGNMTGTLAFGVVAEYAWGHYPQRRGHTIQDSLLAPEESRFSRPGARIALVTGAMFAVALLTGIFSLGPGLGFSGAVFGIAGFAIVTKPRAAIAAVVASSALSTLYQALADPVVRGTISVGPPAPPSWAGIAFQAHMLGFVVGVLLAVGLLWSRQKDLAPLEVFFATLAFGLALSLWLLVWPGGQDVFYLYRGAGVIFVVLLTGLVTIAATGSDRSISRSIAILAVALLAIPFALTTLWFLAALSGAVPELSGFAPFAALLVLAVVALALPALPTALRGEDSRWATRRRTAFLGLGTVAILLLLPGILYGPVAVDTDSITETNEIEVGDYVVTYAENVTGGQELLMLDLNTSSLNQTYDGLLVASDSRSMWTIGERKDSIAFDGEGEVQVGGLGWRETVRAERTGWEVTGNASAYAVDLIHDGERTRSFTSDPVRADVHIDDHRVTVVPTQEEFELRVTRDGDVVGTSAIPDAGDTATVDPLTIRAIDDDGTTQVVVESDGTSVTVAVEETY